MFVWSEQWSRGHGKEDKMSNGDTQPSKSEALSAEGEREKRVAWRKAETNRKIAKEGIQKVAWKTAQSIGGGSATLAKSHEEAVFFLGLVCGVLKDPKDTFWAITAFNSALWQECEKTMTGANDYRSLAVCSEEVYADMEKLLKEKGK